MRAQDGPGPTGRGRRFHACVLAFVPFLAPTLAQGQAPPAFAETTPLVVALDDDDDDEDGQADREADAPPPFDFVPLQLTGSGWATLVTPPGLRVFRGTTALGPDARVALPVELRVQGRALGEHTLSLRGHGAEAERVVRVVSLHFEGATGRVDPRTDALRPSLQIPNDATLPRDPRAALSGDPAAFRVVIADPELEGDEARALLRAIDGDGRRARLPLRLHPRGDGTYVSPWLRLVTDGLDAAAPGVEGRLLHVALRNVVELDYLGATQSVRVGRPGDEDGALAARRVQVDVHVLREGGRPVVGRDPAQARAWAREQLLIASEVWAQCLVDFDAHAVTVHDPAPPALISFGEPEGFLAAGGTLRFAAGETPIGPLTIEAGATPLGVALLTARALRAAGFEATVTLNPRASYAAGPSADVVVRRDSQPVRLRAVAGEALTDDRRLRVRIPQVDLVGGLEEFDNRNAASGSLEERALVLPTRDGDPATIDLYIVNRFEGRTRQGEAFIEGDRGALANTVILDRRGLEQQRTAFTQAHEIGHVLLDQPFHPDDVGDPVPWRLMSAGAADPTLRGPRRLTADECARARDRSGVNARPTLLRRHPGRGR